jgi:hypothetical protein
MNGICQCRSGFIRDPNTGHCICPPGYQILNGTCVQVNQTRQCTCPENEYYDAIDYVRSLITQFVILKFMEKH